MMDFYKTNKANPFSGCLPLIFQLIFLIAIYRVLFNISEAGLLISGSELYSFVHNPGQINQYFLGIIDLAKTVSFNNLTVGTIAQIILIVAAAAAQYYQTKMLMPKQAANGGASDMSQMMSKQMLYLGPLLTLFIGFRFPAGLSLYWLVSTVFAIIQQRQMEKMTAPAKN